MLSLAVILSTFGIIFLAELPDKTALATLILATRHRAGGVIAGACAAFLVQTLVGLAAGSLLAFLPAQPVRIASGVGFLVFAVLALRRREEDDERAEEKSVSRTDGNRPVWLVSFLVIFAAEWGDLTQLATAALVARGAPALSVGIGAVLALWSVTVIAAFSGAQLGKYLKPRLLNIAGAVLFAGIGIAMIVSALR